MAKLRLLRSARDRGAARAPEWLGGRVSMPAYVTREGKPFRPDVLVWVEPDGRIAGLDLARPEEALDQASGSLAHAISSAGGRAPGRLRVAAPELAERLCAGHPGIEIVCRPIPELDDILAGLWEVLVAASGEEPPRILPEVSREARLAFYRAAAGLYRTGPWNVVPRDRDLFSLDVPALGIADAVLSVIGQMGESRGVVLFSSVEDFEDFAFGTDPQETSEEDGIPPNLSLNFEARDDLRPEFLRDIEDLGAEIGGSRGHPCLLAVDGDRLARPLATEDFTLFEAIALALTQALGEKDALLAAWEGGAPWKRTFAVRPHAGPLDVTLATLGLYQEPEPPTRSSHDLLGALYDLAPSGAEPIGEEAQRRLADELLARFTASPEAEGLPATDACRWVMEHGASHIGVTIARLTALDLEEVLFEVIPQKVCVEASQARAMVVALRAFYGYLGRVCGLPQAAACLDVLRGHAAADLEAALADESRYGMAKTLLMQGRDAGYDVHMRAGLEAWLEAATGRAPLVQGDWTEAQAPRPPGDAARPGREKRQKEKREKKARKQARRSRRKRR